MRTQTGVVQLSLKPAMCWLVLLCLNLHSTPSLAAEPVSCLHLRIVGVCIWLSCSLFECHTEETAKIGHFNPEIDVRITHPVGVQRAEDPVRTDTHNRNHNNLIAHDARATGHPFTGQVYCPSQATALIPYFISEVDQPEWRWGIFDALSPNAWVPGLREIGHWPKNTWGNLYPRTGWTTQSSPPKAAAVIAQRVGNIITRKAQPHLYIPVNGEVLSPSKRVWPPGELMENTRSGGHWQLRYPQAETGCRVFGEDDTLATSDWGSGRVSADGAYGYTLWRPYRCCDIQGEAFIGSVDFMDYP